MHTVVDESGRRYLLEKRAGESWRVRDPRTGDRLHRPAAELSVVDGESPLSTAARAVPDEAAARLPVRGDRALGLLATIHATEPVGVRVLLDETDLCESDLHGLLGGLTAAGLIEQIDIDGERGYVTSDRVDWSA